MVDPRALKRSLDITSVAGYEFRPEVQPEDKRIEFHLLSLKCILLYFVGNLLGRVRGGRIDAHVLNERGEGL